MAKRMDGTETWFRVKIEVEYLIRYRSFNKDWNHQIPTTGDIEGSNPMYTQYPSDTHEDFYTYLGPFKSLKALEREYTKFVKHYEDNPQSYRNLSINRCETETALWVEVV